MKVLEARKVKEWHKIRDYKIRLRIGEGFQSMLTGAENLDVPRHPNWISSRGRSIADEAWVAERIRYSTLVLRECVEIDPEKLGGIPVLRGTRLSVAQVIAELAEDSRLSEIADEFDLNAEQLKKLLESIAISLDRPAFK